VEYKKKRNAHKIFFLQKKKQRKQAAPNQRFMKGKIRFKELMLKDDKNEEVVWKFVHIHVEMQYQLMD